MLLPLAAGAVLLTLLLSGDNKVASVTIPPTPDGSAIAYGKIALRRYGPAFLKRVVEIANELGTHPSNLMAVMYAESGLNHNARNPLSGSVSFIQFTGARNVKQLGERNGIPNLTLDKIAAMTPLQALELVRLYFLPFKGRVGNVYDLYTATFLPAFVGKPMETIMYTAQSHAKRYAMNPTTDRDHNGIVTRAESLARIDTIKRRGLEPDKAYSYN